MKRVRSDRRRAPKIKKRRGKRGLGAVPRRQVSITELIKRFLRSFWRIFLSLTLLLIISSPYWGWHLLKSYPIFTIKRVLTFTEGDRELNYLTHERVDDLTQGAVGHNFIGFDVGRYQAAILEEPWIKSAKVERIWPEELKVTIEEEIPVAIYNGEELVDGEGNLFTPKELPYRQFPKLIGPKVYIKEMIDHLYTINNALDPFLLQVDTLIVDERHSWSILLDNGILLVLGSEDFSERFARFVNNYPAQIEPRKDEILRIDFRYQDGFSVQWK